MVLAHGRPMTPRPSTLTFRNAHHRYTLSRLQQDWARLATRPEALAQARSWNVTAVCFEDLDELLVLAGMSPMSPDGRLVPHAASERSRPIGVVGDGVLTKLVLAARSEPLAGRVVLQRMLPGLSAVARRRGTCMNDHLQAFDELLSAAWTVISSFPIERLGVHVAANLLRDADYLAFKRDGRRGIVHEYTDGAAVDHPSDDVEWRLEPLSELLEVVGLAAGGLVDADRELLRMLLTGRNVREVARRMQVTERTIRNHRDAVVHRLRAAWAA
jgi:DNA-directed RNA polymerase specialized sigma24 family protein